MKPVQYVLPQYQDVGGNQEGVSIREFKGINLFDPLSIDESFFTDIVNMDTANYPALTTRPGYTVDYSVTSGVTSVGIQGMTTFRLPSGTEELHVIIEGNGWRVKNSGTWRPLPFQMSGQNMSYQFATALVDDNSVSVNQVCLFTQNGGGKTYFYTQGQGTQQVAVLPDTARFITAYQNRLWCVVDNELWSSKLDQPLQWEVVTTEGDSAAYRRQIETRNGERASMLNGNFTRLMIGSPNMVQELFGGVPSQFNVQPVTGDTGPVNMKGTVTLDGMLYYVNKRGIYQYAGGALPDKDFSEVIGTLIKNVQSSTTSNTDGLRTTAGTDGKKLFFFVDENMFVYDPRPGIQAWSKWSGIVPNHFQVFAGDFYIGDRQGRVLKMGGETDAGTDINWSFTTKAFTVAAVANKQRWYKLWISAELRGTMNVYASTSISGNDFELISTYTANSEVVQRFIIPVRKLARANYIRIKVTGTGYFKLHEITRNQRQLPLY